MSCNAITRAGERCKGVATHGSYCWNHAPETAKQRKQRASKGGKAGGNGRPGGAGMDDVDQAIHNTKVAIGKLMAGDIPRELATAIFSGMHALSRLIELKRRLIEQDAVIARLDAIEAHQRAQGRGTAWHHRQRS